MNNTNIKCNGYKIPRTEFSKATKEMVLKMTNEARDTFAYVNSTKFNASELYKGTRFDSDEAALLRIESATSESEFLKHPSAWVWAALEECATSDAWYRFEKKW